MNGLQHTPRNICHHLKTLQFKICMQELLFFHQMTGGTAQEESHP